MGQIIHIETDQIFEMAVRMDHLADFIDENAQRCSSLVYEADWSGSSREEMIAQMQLLSHRLREQAYELDLLALRVRKEVEEWEEADRRLAAG